MNMHPPFFCFFMSCFHNPRITISHKYILQGTSFYLEALDITHIFTATLNRIKMSIEKSEIHIYSSSHSKKICQKFNLPLLFLKWKPSLFTCIFVVTSFFLFVAVG